MKIGFYHLWIHLELSTLGLRLEIEDQGIQNLVPRLNQKFLNCAVVLMDKSQVYQLNFNIHSWCRPRFGVISTIVHLSIFATTAGLKTL